MNPEDLEKLRQNIAAAKFQPQPRTEQYAFQRGWNEAIEFVERQFGWQCANLKEG
jgi:hypothetical protein